MSWSEADLQRYSSSDGEDLKLSTSILDGLSAGFSEGIQASPTNAISNYLISKTGDQYMSPFAANEKYGLTNTPYAFKEGEEKISDAHARNVLSENLKAEAIQARVQNVSEDYGAIGSVANFSGNLLSGFVDPINLLGGVGTSMALTKGAALFGTAAMKEVVKGATVKHIFAANMAEEFAFSVVADAALIPMGEEAINRETDLKTRVLNVVGSTVFGGILSTGLQTKGFRKAKDITNQTTKQYGSKSEEVLDKSATHGTVNVANGKKPNPDHPVHMMELGEYRTRPDQQPYLHWQLDSASIYEAEFYVGRYLGGEEFDIISDQGTGTLVLVDDFNQASNRVSPIDNTFSIMRNTDDKVGEVFASKLSKRSKILTDDMFVALKADIREALLASFDKFPKTNMDSRSKFLNRVNRELDEANSFTQFKDNLDFELQGDAHDVHSLGDFDDFLNKTLHDELGFDGFATTLNPALMGNATRNAVVLFKPEVFKAHTKPKKSLWVNPVKTADRRGMVSGTDGSGLFYNRGLFENPTTVPATKFDPKHPDAEAYLQPMKDLEISELNRMNDVKAESDYSEELNKVARTAPEADPETYTPSDEILESVGETKESLDVDNYKRGEAEYVNKTDEEITNDVMKVFAECKKNYGG
jgi:hypothetical protein